MSQTPSDLRQKLAFYGAYHSNPTNIWIHIFCVPLIVWSAYVLGAFIPRIGLLPPYHAEFGPYFAFTLNTSAVWALLVELYYFTLSPSVALAHIPVAIVTLLTATAYAAQPNAKAVAAVVHVGCWIAQFYGHGVHEGRSPAVLDNLFQAVFLAPLFVHIEVLFMLGRFKQIKKDLHNDVGKLNAERRLKQEGVKK